ncbi:MAG: phosphohydrolase [Paludibacteraceae bacterium]|nr:phosphohydrolase [Paludibacteraceae bacterium]
MSEFELIEKAIEIAFEAHKGQKDLDGLPVVLHPFAVASKCTQPKEIIVALLHDVVEDSSFTFDDLHNVGIPDDIIQTLRLLTHDKSETYEEYLQRIKASGDEVALHVKLNDLRHNLNRGRRGMHMQQVTKHEKAYLFLTT